MSRDGEAILSAARKWIGTPYVHQASCLGAGCDCLGLIRGVWREIIGEEVEYIPPYPPQMCGEGAGEMFVRALEQALIRESRVGFSAGLVVLFDIGEVAGTKHLGIAATRDGMPSFIHAYSGHGVVESALSKSWKRRAVASFSFPIRSK